MHRRDRNRPNVVDHVVAAVFAAADAAVDDRRQGRRQRNPSVRSAATADAAAATAADATDATDAADEFHGHPNAVGRSPPGPMGRFRVRRPDRGRTGARGHGPDAVPERRQARRERQAGPPTDDVAARLGPVRRRVRVRRRRRAPVRRRRRGRGHVARLAGRTDPGPGRQRVRLGRDAEKSKVGGNTERRAHDLARPPLTGRLSRRTSRKSYSKPNVLVENLERSRNVFQNAPERNRNGFRNRYYPKTPAPFHFPGRTSECKVTHERFINGRYFSSHASQ